MTPALLERHFTKDGTGVRVKESARRSVSFKRGNLLEAASYEGLRPLDVVFCRNVLIYFSDGAVQRAVSLFHQVLAPGGYLFLGHAESLARVSSAFVPIRFQGAIVYQKPEAGRVVSDRIRVLVVDDSAFVRKAVGRMLATADDIEVVGFARDGEEGLALARELRPDVVTLDVRMPKLGGLETLERLMAEQPVPVLLMSTLTQEGAETTLRGLELGAMEFVDKSSVEPMSMLSLAEELISKIRALGGARVRSRPRTQPKGEAAARPRPPRSA